MCEIFTHVFFFAFHIETCAALQCSSAAAFWRQWVRRNYPRCPWSFVNSPWFGVCPSDAMSNLYCLSSVVLPDFVFSPRILHVAYIAWDSINRHSLCTCVHSLHRRSLHWADLSSRVTWIPKNCLSDVIVSQILCSLGILRSSADKALPLCFSLILLPLNVVTIYIIMQVKILGNSYTHRMHQNARYFKPVILYYIVLAD